MFLNIHSKLAEYYSTHDHLKDAKKEIDLIEPRYEKVKGDRFAELNYNGAKANLFKSNWRLRKQSVSCSEETGKCH